MSQQTIHFTDAQKLMRPTAFTTMIKPVGSLCNLDCDYCYYLGKANLYGGCQPKMSEELLERYISQYIEAVQVPVVTFCWHGGEPLLAGLDFYEKAVALQNKYKGNKQIENSLQTNGLLVNTEWCDFFRHNNFLIGLSLDGPRDIHDAYRHDRGGHPTFDRVMRALEMMAVNGVEYNTLSTINNRCAGRGREVYEFMRSVSRYMQFLPVVEMTADSLNGSIDHHPSTINRPAIVPPGTSGSKLAPWSITPKAFGRFMCDIFDEWVISDVGERFVQLFDITLAQWCGVQPSLCSFCPTCGDGLVVEHNGDVYMCDHFVYPEYRLGNIRDEHLSDLQRKPELFRFGVEKRNSLPSDCRQCEYLFACRGECPKHRFATTRRGEKGLNTLCEGYKHFFEYTAPYMQQMRTLLEQGLEASHIIPWARQKRGFAG
ncbi:MAG: anaerobic sulfatase maturase [Bacteroidales bacterium]|nr:anaerobic sulfatase maturase [Bacteroidales bacterium]